MILFVPLNHVVSAGRRRGIFLALQVAIDRVIRNGDTPIILENLYITANPITRSNQCTIIGLN